VKEYYEGYWQRPNTYVDPDPLARNRAMALWNAVRTSGSSPSRFLDVGCGQGDLVAEALARGYMAQGIDISEEAVKRAGRIHPEAIVTAHPVEERPWPLEKESVDLVASFEVIEHLMQPAELIRGSCDVLRPGGYLAITTPYHGILKNVALSLVAFDKHFAVEGDHIRFFSDAALRRILENNGFRVISFNHFGRLPGIWADVFVWAQKV
jgi:2-polyprenyl-3-methyl-5-hydroxy-6-metoxy-1,4-benzoquinol methylase